jgi:hypothetical protein
MGRFKPQKFNLSAALYQASSPRHGQSQPHPADLAALLKMRGTT